MGKSKAKAGKSNTVKAAKTEKPAKKTKKPASSSGLSIASVVASVGVGVAVNVLSPHVIDLLNQLGKILHLETANNSVYQQHVKDIQRLSTIYLELINISEETDERLRVLLPRYQELLLEGWDAFLKSTAHPSDVQSWLQSRIEKCELMEHLLQALPEQKHQAAIRRVKI